jgi:urease accessory protein
MAAVGFCLGPLVGNTALVELTVAVSVVVLGLMLASRWHGSLVWLLLIAVFGLMHGLAHAVELNPNAGFVACFSGFLVATSLLHTAGMGLAFMLRRPLQIRLCGVMIAVFGLFGLVL